MVWAYLIVLFFLGKKVGYVIAEGYIYIIMCRGYLIFGKDMDIDPTMLS